MVTEIIKYTHKQADSDPGNYFDMTFIIFLSKLIMLSITIWTKISLFIVKKSKFVNNVIQKESTKAKRKLFLFRVNGICKKKNDKYVWSRAFH